jgi:Mg2+ and Co2+ transporter CorA
MKTFIKNNNTVPVIVAIITSITSVYIANINIHNKEKEVIEKAILKEMVEDEIGETMEMVKNIRSNQDTMNKMLIDINKILLEHINERAHKANTKQANTIVAQIAEIKRMKK